MDYAKIFGINLRRLRTMRRLSQAAFSQRLADNISVSYISNVEHGKENMTLRQMVRFSEALGMPLEAMLDPRMIRENSK